MDHGAMMRLVAVKLRETGRVRSVKGREVLGLSIIDVVDMEGKLHLFTITKGEGEAPESPRNERAY